MGIKDAIVEVLKKIKCKCKCLGSVEIEIRGCDTPPQDEPQREITNNNLNNNNLSLENNINITPQQSPSMPRRSPAPLPRPHIYQELV